ncbi:MAG: TVP38/TMEM64 family protein [Bdellovibrionaceae bacterium]|nr:TVP38/TMEM64 family protein [Pseudobdellovibrionaceae bacterium]
MKRALAFLFFVMASLVFSLNYESNKTILFQLMGSTIEYIPLKIFVYFLIGMAINFFFVPLGVFYKLLGGYLFGSVFGFALSLLFTLWASYLAFRFSAVFFKIDTKKINDLLNQKIRQEIEMNPFLTVVRLRLFPLFPLQVTNYLLSHLSIGRRHFILGSLVGMAPASLIYSYFGSQLNSEIVRALDVSTVVYIYGIFFILLAITFVSHFIGTKVKNG